MRVFFVDFENKSQNFVIKSISKADTFYQRAERPTTTTKRKRAAAVEERRPSDESSSAAGGDRIRDEVEDEDESPLVEKQVMEQEQEDEEEAEEQELFHVHIFYRSDCPTGLPGNRRWMTHHPIPPSGKNAADYAMIEAVKAYPAGRDDEIYIVCGGDKIYRRTFTPVPKSHHIIDDATHRHLYDYLPLPRPLRLFLFFLRWLFVLRFRFFF